MKFKLTCVQIKFSTFILLSAWQSLLLAGSVDLSNTPLPVTSAVAPNLLFTIDTSGSMVNIVPETPFDESITYLASCPSVFAGGVTAPAFPSTDYTINVDGLGAVTIGGVTFGTGLGQQCFDTNLRYLARLNSGQPYFGATYTGNYLNWYFCTGAAPNCNAAANFVGGGGRKPGVQSRLEISKNAAKLIVNSLSNVRTGLVRYADAYNNSTTDAGGQLALAVADNNATQKTAMETQINSLPANSNTPLSGTLSGIGAYLAKTTTADPTSTLTLHPASPAITGYSDTTLNTYTAAASTIFTDNGKMLINGTAAAAPIQYYCQKSFAVLMTDGRPNHGYTVSAKIRNYLGIMSGLSPTNGRKPVGVDGTLVGGAHVNANGKTQLHLGDPHSYQADGDDYLDDVAAALYDIDLRPDLVSPSGTKPSKNNLLTYTIALADLQAINDPLLQETAAAGGGLFLAAANGPGLVAAFDSAVNDILGKDGSSAAVAVANAHVTEGDNASYSTSYNSGTWSGDLVAYPINIATGVPKINEPIWVTGCPPQSTPPAAPRPQPGDLVVPGDATKGILGCSAQVQLDWRYLVSPATPRKIFTSNGTIGIPFTMTNLLAAQKTRLRTNSASSGATATAEATAVVDYIRGDRTNELNSTMRVRVHLLGDTVNAEPLVIRKPERSYGDGGYPEYKAAYPNRANLILQASNDGMLHAFNELTGSEEWAYIPGMLIDNSNDPADSTISLLNTRTRKAGFVHYNLLDSTPFSGDVDFDNTGTAVDTSVVGYLGDWGTIAVGGMGKGGRGYYALNVTTPTANDEATVATKLLWEFPNSINNASDRARVKLDMGYSFTKPIIVKTRAKGWVVLVASGYNNGTNAGESGGDGLGHLYVINAKTGDLIADLITTGCHATPLANPCGLANINAYIEAKDFDNTVDLVYGGDLYGNLWRFDLRGTQGPSGGTAASRWSVSKVATLRSGPAASDALQPVTTVPELTKTSAGEYMIYVGTGKYLGQTDLPCPPSGPCPWTPNAASTQTQTMYGLKEPRTAVATVEVLPTLADPLKPNLIQQTYSDIGSPATSRLLTTNTVAAAKKGWYINYTGGERVVTDPAISAGTLTFSTDAPTTIPCIPGGSSWLYAVDYETGGNVRRADGTYSTWSGVSLGDALASRPIIVQLPNGAIKAIVRLSDTTTKVFEPPLRGAATNARRVSWRELLDQ